MTRFKEEYMNVFGKYKIAFGTYPFGELHLTRMTNEIKKTYHFSRYVSVFLHNNF